MVAIGAVLLWFLMRLSRSPHQSPRKAVADELDQIARDERFAQLAAEKGAKLANDIADIEYRQAIRSLDAGRKAKVEAMRGNPSKRVRYLRRVAKRLERQAADNRPKPRR